MQVLRVFTHPQCTILDVFCWIKTAFYTVVSLYFLKSVTALRKYWLSAPKRSSGVTSVVQPDRWFNLLEENISSKLQS